MPRIRDLIHDRADVVRHGPPVGSGRAPHQEDDPERHQPAAPQHVADEVQEVDERQVQRGRDAEQDQGRRHPADRDEQPSGERVTECDEDERGPGGGEQVAAGLADQVAEHAVRGGERLLRRRIAPGRGGRPARHEQRPAEQADDLHDGGGHSGADGPAHRRGVGQAADAQRHRREQRRAEREEQEPGADRALRRPEGRQDLGGGVLEDVRVVEDHAEASEGDVDEHGGGDHRDGGGAGGGGHAGRVAAGADDPLTTV